MLSLPEMIPKIMSAEQPIRELVKVLINEWMPELIVAAGKKYLMSDEQ